MTNPPSSTQTRNESPANKKDVGIALNVKLQNTVNLDEPYRIHTVKKSKVAELQLIKLAWKLADNVEEINGKNLFLSDAYQSGPSPKVIQEANISDDKKNIIIECITEVFD